MKKNKLKLFGFCLGSVALVASAIAPAIALSSCASGSGTDANNGANNQNPSVAPLPAPNAAELENITTFAQAMDFTNKYLQKNYTLEMFKSDFLNKYKIFDQPTKPGEPEPIKVSFKFIDNKNNKINCVFEINMGSQQEGGSWGREIIVSKISNLTIYPFLCYNEQKNTLTPQIAINWDAMGGYTYQFFGPLPTFYSSLNELKQANLNWSNEEIVEVNITDIDKNNIEQKRPTYFYIAPSNFIVKNKILTPDPLDNGCAANGCSFLLNGAFSFDANKITDLQQHLQK